MNTAKGKSLSQNWPIIAFAGFDFSDLRYHRPSPAIEIGPDRFLLSFKAKAGCALLGGGYSVVSDKFAFCHLKASGVTQAVPDVLA
jgi:hypothetical protein